MNVEDISYSANAPARSNHYLLLQRSISQLIIGKSDCGKTTLLNNLFLRDGWLRLQSIVRLHQTIYQLLEQALEKSFPKEDIETSYSARASHPTR